TCSRFRDLIISSRILSQAYDNHRITIFTAVDALSYYKAALRAIHIAQYISTADVLRPRSHKTIAINEHYGNENLLFECRGTRTNTILLMDGISFILFNLDIPGLQAEFTPMASDNSKRGDSFFGGLSAEFGVFDSEFELSATKDSIILALVGSDSSEPDELEIQVHEISISANDFGAHKDQLGSLSLGMGTLALEDGHEASQMELHIRVHDPHVFLYAGRGSSSEQPAVLYNWRTGTFKRFHPRRRQSGTDKHCNIIHSNFHPFRDAIVIEDRAYDMGYPTATPIFLLEIDITSLLSGPSTESSPFTETFHLRTLAKIDCSDTFKLFKNPSILLSTPIQISGVNSWNISFLSIPNYENDKNFPGGVPYNSIPRNTPSLFSVIFTEGQTEPTMSRTSLPVPHHLAFQNLHFLAPGQILSVKGSGLGAKRAYNHIALHYVAEHPSSARWIDLNVNAAVRKTVERSPNGYNSASSRRLTRSLLSDDEWATLAFDPVGGRFIEVFEGKILCIQY
ncbi:hypothetical protein SISNIDRAFT_460705, partial [Sistotremastrum niveocremeum HHB9708]